MATSPIDVHLVTSERWDDLERRFGPCRPALAVGAWGGGSPRAAGFREVVCRSESRPVMRSAIMAA